MTKPNEPKQDLPPAEPAAHERRPLPSWFIVDASTTAEQLVELVKRLAAEQKCVPPLEPEGEDEKP